MSSVRCPVSGVSGVEYLIRKCQELKVCLCVMCLVTLTCDGILGGLGLHGLVWYGIGFRYSYFLLFGWREELEKHPFRDNIINLNLSSWVYIISKSTDTVV